jgi:RNA polymerase sigma-70 factor, ECF subfamily
VIDAVYRAESRCVLATLIGGFELAEALHETFAAAASDGRARACRANPRAWLISTGRSKAIDAMRRRARSTPCPSIRIRRDDRSRLHRTA